MKVGSIHKNSKTRYFAVGGYFSYEEDKLKIKAKYKKENLKLKKEKNLSLDAEIKSYDMTENEKIQIFTKIQDIETFHGCVKVFDKEYMKKEIVDSNIFFNYAVKVLIQDCILPELNLQDNDEPIEFIISIDNRNIRVGELNNLETYLKTEFCNKLSKMSNEEITEYLKSFYPEQNLNFEKEIKGTVYKVNTYFNKDSEHTILTRFFEIFQK